MLHQTSNGITLVDGFYWVANLPKKYVSIISIQNKENLVKIFGMDTKMTVQNLVNLEKMGGVVVLSIVDIPKKVLNYEFPQPKPQKTK